MNRLLGRTVSFPCRRKECAESVSQKQIWSPLLTWQRLCFHPRSLEEQWQRGRQRQKGKPRGRTDKVRFEEISVVAAGYAPVVSWAKSHPISHSREKLWFSVASVLKAQSEEIHGVMRKEVNVCPYVQLRPALQWVLYCRCSLHTSCTFWGD